MPARTPAHRTSARFSLRHQVFLGSEAFVERHCTPSKPAERLREVPPAQRRSLAKPLADFALRYPVRREAIARAFQTGVYTMQEIADYFGVHCSTVSLCHATPGDRPRRSDGLACQTIMRDCKT